MKDFFSKILVDLLAKVIVGLLVAVGALLVASPTLRAWAVSEYLVQKWAVWIFFPMFILVTAAASAWLGRVRGSRAGSGPQNLTLTDGDPTYVPTELEDECIVLIRFSDELGVTVKTMHGVMNEGHAVRDLEYAAGSTPFSRTLTRRPIKAMRSVHVKAQEVHCRVQAWRG
ncbi:hypothetical protein [Xanthomonas axonopodis]